MLTDPDLVDGQMQRLNDMKAIENNSGTATLTQSEQIRIVHIDNHELQAPGALEPKPQEEPLENSAVVATAHPEDTTFPNVGDQR